MWSRVAGCFAIAACGWMFVAASEPAGVNLAAGVVAEAATPLDVPALIKLLHSEKYRERENATAALLRLRPAACSDIENALAGENDDEAISRLTQVALHLYLKDPARTPLAGQASLLGIALRPEILEETLYTDHPQMAVVVIDTKPGFPAYEVLKPGDRIMAIDEQPFPSDYTVDNFRAKVNSKAPGSFLNVTVLRDGKQFKAAVQVAGLEFAGENFLNRFVELRQVLGRKYMETLRTGSTIQPLVMKDDTPSSINLYNEFEFEDVP